MVEFAGTYQLVESVNPAEFLKVAGEEVTDQKLAGLTNPNSKLTVEVDGDNFVFITSITDAWKRETKFTIGKDFQEEAAGIGSTTTTPTKEGDNIFLTSSYGDKTIQRLYKFTDGGVALVLNAGSGVQAKRIYKRL